MGKLVYKGAGDKRGRQYEVALESSKVYIPETTYNLPDEETGVVTPITSDSTKEKTHTSTPILY